MDKLSEEFERQRQELYAEEKLLRTEDENSAGAIYQKIKSRELEIAKTEAAAYKDMLKLVLAQQLFKEKRINYVYRASPAEKIEYVLTEMTRRDIVDYDMYIFKISKIPISNMEYNNFSRKWGIKYNTTDADVMELFIDAGIIPFIVRSPVDKNIFQLIVITPATIDSFDKECEVVIYDLTEDSQ